MGARLLLDADTPPALAGALARLGHDVVSASGDRALESLSDVELLREALRQDRVLVTFNVVDFVELTRELARGSRAHAGVILIHARSFRRTDIAGMAGALDRLLRSGRDLGNAVIYLSKQKL